MTIIYFYKDRCFNNVLILNFMFTLNNHRVFLPNQLGFLMMIKFSSAGYRTLKSIKNLTANTSQSTIPSNISR